MTAGTCIGIILVIGLIIGVGLLSGRKVRDAKDFINGGGKAGSFMVCGVIMGSLVSSQATIGTAQLAFNYGLAAWWFTLGAGIGCLFLAVGYVRPLRRSRCTTELQIISKEYGSLAGKLGSVLCSIGIFISVLAQVVACAGLITVLFPAVGVPVAVLLSITVMCLYVIFGGAWGAGMGGIVKLVLLAVASVTGFIFVLVSSHGVSGLAQSLQQLLAGTDLGLIQNKAAGLSNLQTTADLSHRFFNLTARGASIDIGSGLSLLLGVLSTQTYAQAIWSGKTDKTAKRGALLGACLIPPIGIAGTCIGLYMRAHYITQAEVRALTAAGMAVPNLPVLAKTIQVFPTFLLNTMPHLFAGIVLGTLLITVVGGGAGLSLGMATIMVNDIYKEAGKKKPGSRLFTPKGELLATRGTIAAILVISAIIAATVSDATINDLGFLSMGLRAAVVFVPMTCALFLKGKINPRCALLSVILSPLAVLAGKYMKLPFDSLFLGMAISIVICAIGILIPRRYKISVDNIWEVTLMQTNELIITIRETAGSGAEKIGKLLADQLGVPCYGKEILDKASEISGIERRIFDKYDELPVFAGLDLTAPNEDTIELPDTNTLANAQMAAVKALAVKSCVLVGRYSALALAEHRNACHFVLDDDFEARRKRLEMDAGHSISIFKLRKTDKLRKLYYRSEERWASEAGKQVLITRQGRSDRQIADLILKQLTKVEKGA